MKLNELNKTHYYKRNHWEENSWVIGFNTKTKDWHYVTPDNEYSEKGIGITLREADNFIRCNLEGESLVPKPPQKTIEYRSDYLYVDIVFTEANVYIKDSKRYTYKIGGKKLDIGARVVVEANNQTTSVAYVIGYREPDFVPPFDCRWVIGPVLDTRTPRKSRTESPELCIQSIVNGLVQPDKED